jgi:hypothetical protein
MEFFLFSNYERIGSIRRAIGMMIGRARSAN